jgi:CRISPR-associated endonuclease/helicase Cas3
MGRRTRCLFLKRLIGRDVLDFPYRTVAQGFRVIESGMEPVIVAVEDKARSVVIRLRAGTIPPGVAARALQTFVVQVPPAWRRKLIENGHAEFVPGYGDQFAELKNRQLYDNRTGLLWEDADSLVDSGII